jgi:hypothetical protein
MNNTIISALDEQFKKDCKVINLKYEYPGYTGIEQWAIITDLSEDELCTKYAEQVAPYCPYIILTNSFGAVRDIYCRNEKKHQMRAIRNGHAFDFSEDTEEHHAEILSSISLEDEIIYNEEIQQLRDAIQKLNTIQKTRLVKYFFEGKTFREIASEENVNIRAVAKSIEVAIKNLKKFL